MYRDAFGGVSGRQGHPRPFMVAVYWLGFAVVIRESTGLLFLQPLVGGTQ